MTESDFVDKSQEPNSSDLEKALGKTAILLQSIEQHLFSQFGELTREWRFYSKKAGWTLALAHKGRRVFHLIPQSGFFTVVFILGERAVLASRESNLPEEILSLIVNAREHAEGRSIRFNITTPEDVAAVKQLITIKMTN